GTLEAARKTLIDDVYAQKYNTAFFKNTARPEGAMSFDQVLSEEDYPRIRSEIEEVYGGPEKAHRIGIFGKGAKWVNIGMSQKDMDFVLLRKMNRLELAGVFGVKPTMVNTYEDVNYNTARQQKKEFWHDTGVPKIIEFVEWLNIYSSKFLGKAFKTALGDFYFGYDLSRVPALMEEERERLKSDIEAVQSGIYTINKVLERRNEDPVPWGDVWWKPMQLVPTIDPESVILPGAGGPPTGKASQENEDLTKNPRILSARSRSEEWRAAEWRAFAVHTDYWERLFGGFVINLLADQEKLVKKNLRDLFMRLAGAEQQMRAIRRKLTEADIEAIIFDLDAAILSTTELSTDLYERIMKAGGQHGFTIAEVAGSFDISDPFARKAMLMKQQKFAKEISETTWNLLKRSLVAGAAQG
ncbi:MAG: phage portal protein, partial [Candidatus Latescibacteria bacterium]|nr:phage portal protein [Candidatus Latescibacterota bacterium]NIO77756.1 phage portal protein [Candidatus Latescibacterota bacterium]